MCLNPQIIVNPSFVKLSAYGRYPGIHMPGRDFFYTRNAFDFFDYKRFSVRRNGVTKDNLDDFYAYNFEGETLPLFIEVSCGRCPVCVMRKRNDLKNKMLLEQSCYDVPPIFLTLTYRDSDLPEDGVSVRDVQLFLKRFRSYVSYHYPNFSKFRYICFSEYGSLRGRPHYHLLIFGLSLASPRDVLYLNRDMFTCWTKGFTYARLCDHGCFNYVSKYVCKGSNVPVGKNPNFRLSSRGDGGLGTHAFHDDSLYLKLIQSPHPLISLKILGRVFQVYIPKSVRERLCRSPRQFIPVKIRDAYKSFCFKSLLLHTIMSESDDFASHVNTFCKISGIQPPSASSVVPRVIYDKYAALEQCPINLNVPSYMRSFSKELLKIHGHSSSEHDDVLTQYVKLYKILDEFNLDFGELFHFTYLRSTVYRRWTLSLVNFAENNPDTDPLSVAKFNAILIESNKNTHLD